MSGDEQLTTGADRQTRRALLAGAGAVGAAVVLSGCGTDTTPAATPASPGQQSAPAAGGGAVAKTSEIPVGGGKIIADAGVVVTQPTEGDFKAFSNICTHQGCPVTQVGNGTIDCRCHASKFSIEDGSPKGGPANKPLAAKQVTVNGDEIVLA